MRVSVVIAVVCLSTVGLSAADEVEAAVGKQTDIPVQPLALALQQLAGERDVQLIYRSEIVGDRQTGGATGVLTFEEALSQVLSGTGLTYQYLGDEAITIVPVHVESSDPQGSQPGALRAGSWFLNGGLAGSGEALSARRERGFSRQGSRVTRGQAGRDERANDGQSTYKQELELEEITVTGTRIRGARPSSPVVTVTQEEMRLKGHSNLGEVIRALPQNYAGGQNPTIGLGAGGGGANANYTGSSSLNLRGLGTDATLTLLNGARLPYDGIIQATDVSVIPTAAVERLEILLDGASAIYGSDAVGGVANIILKRDFEGAELSARFGTATDGGYDQQQYTLVAGTTWGSGGFLITGEASDNTAVRAGQRDYLDSMPNPDVTIHPSSNRQGTLLSAHQAVGDTLELTVDAFYTDRDSADVGQTSVIFDNERNSVIWGVAPALTWSLSADWSMRLHGSAGRNDVKLGLRAFDTVTGEELTPISPITRFLNEAEAAGIEFEGPVFALPGGKARASFGGGYRNAVFEEAHVVAGTTVVEGDAGSYNAFGEINLPLIGEEQGMPWAHRLALNLALRYEDHETFGDVTTAKVGLIWGVTPSLDFKASWGESFKAPTLRQRFQATQLNLYPSLLFPGLPAGTTAMFAFGGNPGLDPEQADVVTAGFVLQPESWPDFHLEVGWFDIEYTDRVVQPFTSLTLLLDPAFAAFLTLDPTVEEQNAFFEALGFPVGTFTLNGTTAPYDPATVGGIINNLYSNATADRTSGVDVVARYSTEAFHGRLTLTANANWIEATRQLTPAAPDIDAAGDVFFPANFKGRAGASWSRGGFTLTGTVNHIGGVDNTLVTPSVEGDSMTTFDLVVDYRADTGPLGEIGFNAGVINLFDEEPPYRESDQPFFPPYDSTNYSALGRLVSMTVTKGF